jgi:hypothetical protein
MAGDKMINLAAKRQGLVKKRVGWMQWRGIGTLRSTICRISRFLPGEDV